MNVAYGRVDESGYVVVVGRAVELIADTVAICVRAGGNQTGYPITNESRVAHAGEVPVRVCAGGVCMAVVVRRTHTFVDV